MPLVRTLQRYDFGRCFNPFRLAEPIHQLFNERARRHTTVPYHNRDLPRGTVAAILRQAGLTRDDFLNLL
jgi:hypothetical protein